MVALPRLDGGLGGGRGKEAPRGQKEVGLGARGFVAFGDAIAIVGVMRVAYLD